MYDIKNLKFALCQVYCGGNQLWSKSVFLRRILYIHVYILPDRVYVKMCLTGFTLCSVEIVFIHSDLIVSVLPR